MVDWWWWVEVCKIKREEKDIGVGGCNIGGGKGGDGIIGGLVI